MGYTQGTKLFFYALTERIRQYKTITPYSRSSSPSSSSQVESDTGRQGDLEYDEEDDFRSVPSVRTLCSSVTPPSSHVIHPSLPSHSPLPSRPRISFSPPFFLSSHPSIHSLSIFPPAHPLIRRPICI